MLNVNEFAKIFPFRVKQTRPRWFISIPQQHLKNHGGDQAMDDFIGFLHILPRCAYACGRSDGYV
jgi:hypothetical protein